jgi:hypothetical protein
MPPPSTCHREQRCPHQWQQWVQTPDHQRPDTSVWSGTACAAEPVETNERRRGVGQAAQSSNSYRRCHSCPASSARHCVSLVCVQRDVLPLPMSAFHQPLPCPARPCSCDHAVSAASQRASTVLVLMVCTTMLIKLSVPNAV